jgi:Domain of unknown function (DUF4174)
MKYAIAFCLIWVTFSAVAQNRSYRQIYLFAPNLQDSNLKEQRQILASDTEGVKERDLRVTVILAEPDSEKLLKRYKVQTDKFTFLLMGKDGGEKFRSSKIVTLERLFTLIDGMPMRQDEMKRRN